MPRRTFLAPLPAAALAPLPAVALGAVIAVRAGVAWPALAPGAAGLLAGWLAWWGSRRRPSLATRAAALAPWLALAALAGTLLAPGLDGVHRWLPLGPLRLGASAAFAPWLLLGLAAAPRLAGAVGAVGAVGAGARAAVALVAAQLIHLAQPDAAQATGLALGALPLLLDRDRVRPALALPAALAIVLAAAAAWHRPDPLAPVPHVEGILALARDQGALVLGAALVSVALVFVPLAAPAFPAGAEAPRDQPCAVAPAPGRAPWRPALAAVLYALGALAAAGSGRFPVPLLGAGAAHVLGWFGLLALARFQIAAAVIDGEDRRA